MTYKPHNFFPLAVAILTLVNMQACNKTAAVHADKKLLFAAKYVPHMSGNRLWHSSVRTFGPHDTTYFLADITAAIVVVNDTTIQLPIFNSYVYLSAATDSILSFYREQTFVGRHVDKRWYATYYVNRDSIIFSYAFGESLPTTYTYSTQ